MAMAKQHRPKKFITIKHDGFTLIECITTVAIVGILSSIALPNYTQSVCRSSQAEAVSELSILQTTAMSFADEFGTAPTTWAQMNAIAPVQTLDSNGNKVKASGTINSTPQTLRSNKYELSGSSTNGSLTFNTEPTKGCATYNAEACINTKTGETDVEKGNQSAKATSTTC